MLKVRKQIVVLLTMFLSFSLVGCSDPDLTQHKDQAPSFELSTVEGNQINLENLSGKVYLKFWASWCSACLSGLEELDQLAAEQTNFDILTIVSPGYNGEMNADDFTDWFKSLDYDHITVLLDNKGTVAKKYEVLAYPASYYINSNGALVSDILGHNPNDMIKKEMAEIN